ncbi:MAG: thiamine diphosphokinase [Candidatus Zhuqueibacterota bacterium]
MNRNTIAIIANGEMLHASLMQKIIKQSDIIIVTDGGIKSCRAADIQPHYIIGDMDSSTGLEREFFSSARIIHDPDQETTDMQKALHFAASLKPQRIKVMAALGKRADHSTANLLILQEFNSTCPVEIYDNFGRLTLLRPGNHALNVVKGSTVSFFSLGPISGLSLSGFQFNLAEKNYPSYFIGISNVVAENGCQVTFETGGLFMYEAFIQ